MDRPEDDFDDAARACRVGAVHHHARPEQAKGDLHRPLHLLRLQLLDLCPVTETQFAAATAGTALA